ARANVEFRTFAHLRFDPHLRVPVTPHVNDSGVEIALAAKSSRRAGLNRVLTQAIALVLRHLCAPQRLPAARALESPAWLIPHPDGPRSPPIWLSGRHLHDPASR